MVSGEEVDWAEEWRRQFRKTMDVRGSTNYYEEEDRARKYAAMQHLWKDGEKRVDGIPLDPTWTVLDIGSGPGIMTIPLAKRCSRVTAVEPSAMMVKLLQENVSSHDLDNIDVVQTTWEEAGGLVPHDVVVASYSLLMPDILPALLKMNSLARERVHIYWFAGMTYWERARLDLYPAIYGRPYHPGPKVDVLFNLLYHLGLYPDLEVLGSLMHPERGMTMEETLDDLRDLVMLEPSAHDDILEEYVRSNYERQGSLFMRPDCTVRVRLSWRPRPVGRT